MKYIINLKPGEKLSLNDIEKKVRSAKNTNDYILVNYGRKGEFMKLCFEKDQTYGLAHNIWNMEFWTKLRVMNRQYKVANAPVLALFLTNWVNKLNK